MNLIPSQVFNVHKKDNQPKFLQYWTSTLSSYSSCPIYTHISTAHLWILSYQSSGYCLSCTRNSHLLLGDSLELALVFLPF